MKQIVCLPKVSLQFSKKDIIIKERRVKGQIRKIASQKKHPKENLPKIWVYTNHVIFLKELSRLQKLNFLLKEYMGDISDWVWRKIFCELFSQSFFLQPRIKNTPKKKPAETQSMKIHVKSEEIRICKNVGKIMQNIGSRRLTSKSAKLTC